MYVLLLFEVTLEYCVVYCVQNLRSGTTAVVSMVTDSHLYMGWTGDSQIILVRRVVPVFTSQPHKPEREVCCYNCVCAIYITHYAHAHGHNTQDT